MPINSLPSNVRSEPEQQKCIKDAKHIGGHSKTLTFTKRKRKKQKASLETQEVSGVLGH